MTDYLLVHGAGQGAWTWDHVWGYLTAPVEHPPRLYTPRRANKVYPLDLPGHGADVNGDTGEVRLEECVHAITRAVEREGLRNVVIVAHGIAATMALQAASELPQPPKRIVMVAGVIPANHKNMVSVFPGRTRRGFAAISVMSKLSHQDLKLPKTVIASYLCNGMSPMEVVHLVGYFGPLPTRVLKTRVELDSAPPPCPVTYVVLTQDKIVPPAVQRRIAAGIPGVEVVELDSCHQVTQFKPKELADILLRYA